LEAKLWSTCSIKGRGRLVAVAPPGPFHNSRGHFRQPGGEMAPWRRQWVNQGPRVWVFVGAPWISKKQQQKLNSTSGSSIETLIFAGSYSIETMIT